MSVIVMGMEMPESCESCGVTCVLWMRHKVGQRHPDCPLRPLPDVHGRLIDADALPRYTGYALSADEVATAVENAPTIVERKENEMNREILFRGKQCYTGKWVYGYLSEDGCELPVIETTRFRSAVEPDTIGQSTGLTDKNGKKIFEGDILRQKKNGVYGFPFSVVFDDGGFMWNENGRRDFLYQSICDTCEVVGNIHDNPELMEGE